MARKFRNFSEALLIESTQRISNTFYLLKHNGVVFQFLHGETIYKVGVMRINTDQIILYAPDFDHKIENFGKIYFEISNGYYCSDIYIIEISNKDQITINFPDKLFCLKDRKYPRVKFDDLFVRFNLLYSTKSRSKNKGSDLDNKYPYFIQEVTKDMPSLKLVYSILMHHIKQIAHDFSIVTFRQRSSESYTIYETTLLEAQKTIFIQDVTKTKSYIEELSSDTLINLFNYYNQIVNHDGELEAAHKMQELRREDSKNFLISYLMSPIYFYDEIIGYVRVETNQFQKYRIHRLLAEEFHNICSIFSYGLTKINIWKSYFAEEATRTRVINISLDGMLIEIFDQVLFAYLKNFKNLKIMLPVFGKELELGCQIVRLFQRGGGFYLGIYIFKGAPGDLELLANYISKNLQYDFF